MVLKGDKDKESWKPIPDHLLLEGRQPEAAAENDKKMANLLLLYTYKVSQIKGVNIGSSGSSDIVHSRKNQHFFGHEKF